MFTTARRAGREFARRTRFAILFRGADGPLIIDQPEDALSKSYLFEVVVSGVRAANAKQQLIFATYDANIPALGGVERLFQFVSDAVHTKVHVVPLGDLTRTIERQCEGHENALPERAAVYGYEVRRKDGPADRWKSTSKSI